MASCSKGRAPQLSGSNSTLPTITSAWQRSSTRRASRKKVFWIMPVCCCFWVNVRAPPLWQHPWLTPAKCRLPYLSGRFTYRGLRCCRLRITREARRRLSGVWLCSHIRSKCVSVALCMLHVTRHTSHVTRHTSHVMPQMKETLAEAENELAATLAGVSSNQAITLRLLADPPIDIKPSFTLQFFDNERITSVASPAITVTLTPVIRKPQTRELTACFVQFNTKSIRMHVTRHTSHITRHMSHVTRARAQPQASKVAPLHSTNSGEFQGILYIIMRFTATGAAAAERAWPNARRQLARQWRRRLQRRVSVPCFLSQMT